MPGNLNTVADEESRMVTDSSDWQLDTRIFKKDRDNMGFIDRLVCVSLECALAFIRLLAALTRDDIGRRLRTFMAKPERIRFSPFRSNL